MLTWKLQVAETLKLQAETLRNVTRVHLQGAVRPQLLEL